MSSKESNTRTKILDAAVVLLSSGSPGSVRMADIAKRAGVSRQAVYLHFPARAELLIEATRHVDRLNDVDAHLAKSRSAETGSARLDAFVEAWGGYIPVVYPILQALMVMSSSDDAAAAAVADRDQAVRHGCEAAVQALRADGELLAEFTVREATDVLWAMLSVQTWSRLTAESGWSQKRYVDRMKVLTRRVLTGQPA